MSKGNVRRYQKNKGYESISRNMLQDVNLSIGAIGLLAHLTSFPENWKLYKTELYTRFNKSKRTQINNAWNELVEERYIVQLRKRVGKKYEYLYFHSQEKFDDEDIEYILQDHEGFDIWDGKMKKKKEETGKIETKKDDDLECGFSTVENEQSKMNCSKPADNRFTRKEVYQKEIDYKEIEYLSIKEELESLDLPEKIKIVIQKQIDRLISDNIDIKDIETNYHANKNKLDVWNYAIVMETVLIHTKTPIRSIHAVMRSSIMDYLNQDDKPQKTENHRNPSRDVVPDWYKQGKHKEKPEQKDDAPMSEEQKQVAEMLKRYTEEPVTT